ncbi:hypothetical protein [Pontibacter mangrovi]|uniref:Uncharacterized protein n=1 Tax=Pontibacter mangrovi TaxID=2589816 RepID=A0A501W5Y4_9BACT|nr:hypothetical protein [Pontibacter mangrovi]TPE43710.1 hypothetical protein FJM65_13275 [Pontibacter mangrovi]
MLIIIVLLITLSAFVFQQQEKGEKIRYHEIDITASSINLIKWDIKDTSNTAFVQEVIDAKGRTEELRFYDSAHRLTYTGSGFYGGPIIRYDYEENKITETFFSDENEIAHDFSTSEVPFRFIYHLNKSNQITHIETKYKLEFDWTNESLNETIKLLKLYKQYTPEEFDLKEVFGYGFASAKLNGVNPKLLK